jgi:hypothetical protein
VRRPPRSAVSATQLAKLAQCETRLLLDLKHGERDDAQSIRRKEHGNREHERFLALASSTHNDALRRGRCFIASAALGPDDPATQSLRRFRDRALRPRRWGRGVILAYYRASPAIADVVSRRRTVRALVARLLRTLVHTLPERFTRP